MRFARHYYVEGVGYSTIQAILNGDMQLPALLLILFAAKLAATSLSGGTGAAMTAVTMIFEMTRDYDLVMPSIVAVALAIGVRRLLSAENIYTIKLVGRGHFVPKAMHANMFLVRQARDVMERDLVVTSADADLDEFLRQHGTANGYKHVVVARGNHIAGVVRINTAASKPPIPA